MTLLRVGPSRLRTYYMCGEKYRRKYTPPYEDTGSTVEALVGDAYHHSAEINHKQKVKTSEDLLVVELQDLAADRFQQRVDEDMILFMPDELPRKGRVIGSAKDQAVRLMSFYWRKIAPRIYPLEVERTLDVNIGGYEGRCRVDVITTDHVIKDLKTSARRYTKVDVVTDLQLLFNAIAYKAEYGQYPEAVGLEIALKLRTPELQSFLIYPTDDDYLVLFRQIKAFIDAVEAGVFPPSGIGQWWCSPRWCNFWWTCKYVSRAQRQTMLTQLRSI